MNSAFLCFSWENRKELGGIILNCMWALGWVLIEARWQTVVGGVVSAVAQRPKESPHTVLLLWSPAPAGIEGSAGFQGFALSLSPLPAHGEWCSDAPTAALQLGMCLWFRRQNSPNSMAFPLTCLFPKEHLEGPQSTAYINLMVTLRWPGFAAPVWTLSAMWCAWHREGTTANILNKASVGGGKHPTSRN